MRSLRRAAACCDPVVDLPGFSRPPAKIPVYTLLSEYLDARLPEDEFPWDLRNELVIEMSWEILPHPVTYTSMRIGRETSLYFEWNENQNEGPCLITVATGMTPSLAHKAFLRALFASNGSAFHAALLGELPSGLVSCLPRTALVASFLAAADAAAGSGRPGFWDELLSIAVPAGVQTLNITTKTGRRRAIQAYLDAVLS